MFLYLPCQKGFLLPPSTGLCPAVLPSHGDTAASPFSEMESRALGTEAGKIVRLSSKLENPTNSTGTLGGFLMLAAESPPFGDLKETE